ncbi:MAG: hypothetical protein ABSF88_09055 [Candidatus Aminicenantales bacterium]
MSWYVCDIYNVQKYKSYLFIIIEEYGPDYELFTKNMKVIGDQLGKDKVAVFLPDKFTYNQAKDLFEIKDKNEMPILVITNMNPDEILKRKTQKSVFLEYNYLFKIILGKISTTDERWKVFKNIVDLLESEDIKNIAREARKVKIDAVLKKYGKPVSLVVDLASIIIGLAKP